MKNRLLLTALFAMSSYHGMQCERLTSSEAYIAPRLGQLAVLHKDKDFFVEDEQGAHKVQRCFVDKNLRGVSKENLAKFLALGYVSVNRCGEKDFSVKAHHRLNGGGPITGAVLYWITKVGCYGTAAGAAGTVIIATGGAAGAISGAGAAVTGGAIAAGAGTGGASIAAGALAGGLASTATGAAIATTGTAAVITSAGGVAGAVAAVEVAATGAFALGLAIPFLP